jgi:hypothetical protein
MLITTGTIKKTEIAGRGPSNSKKQPKVEAIMFFTLVTIKREHRTWLPFTRVEPQKL